MADQFGDAQHALGRLAGVAVMGSRHSSSTPETSRLVRRLEGGAPHRIMIRQASGIHMMMQVEVTLRRRPGPARGSSAGTGGGGRYAYFMRRARWRQPNP
jgi:hypothetical protein